MIIDTTAQALLIVVVGLVVGSVSSLSGLGAGLSLPLLVMAGLPLPAVLLAVKLPVAMGDLASGVAEQRQARRSAGVVAPRTPAELVWATLAGAVAAFGVMFMAPWAVLVAAPWLAVLAVALRYAQARQCHPLSTPWHAVAWGAYVGGCGIGAGVLWRLPVRRKADAARRYSLTRWATPADGAALRAAANAGAVVTLLVAGQQLTAALCLLAAAQGAGAWLMRRLGGAGIGGERGGIAAG